MVADAACVPIASLLLGFSVASFQRSLETLEVRPPAEWCISALSSINTDQKAMIEDELIRGCCDAPAGSIANVGQNTYKEQANTDTTTIGSPILHSQITRTTHKALRLLLLHLIVAPNFTTIRPRGFELRNGCGKQEEYR